MRNKVKKFILSSIVGTIFAMFAASTYMYGFYRKMLNGLNKNFKKYDDLK